MTHYEPTESPLIHDKTQENYYNVSPKTQERGPIPTDKHNLVYWAFFLYGAGILLPWNAVLTAIDFFSEKFTGYQPAFIFPFAFQSFSLVFQILIIVVLYKIPYTIRIVSYFAVATVVVVVLPIIAQYTGPDTGYAVCLGILFCFGIFSGIGQASVFAYAGMLPFRYMGAVMVGNGFSGIVIGVLRFITLLVFPTVEEQYYGTLVYFAITGGILVVGLFTQFFLQKHKFVKYYIQKAHKAERRETMHIKRELKNREENDIQMSIDDSESSLSYSQIAKADHDVQYQQSPISDQSDLVEKGVDKDSQQFWVMFKRSFSQAWQYLVTIGMIFVITFTVYPGASLDTNISFLNGINPEERGSWKGWLIVFVFNIADTVGRQMGSMKFFMISDKATFILAYSRVIFIATFMLIAFQLDPQWLFGNSADWFKMLNLILFGLSNGYCSTLLAIKAPSKAKPDSKESVGTFVGISIITGIFTGAIIAIGVGKIVPKN